MSELFTMSDSPSPTHLRSAGTSPPGTSGMDRKIPRKLWSARKTVWLTFFVLLAAGAAWLLFFRSTETSHGVLRERLLISTVSHGPFQEFIPVTGTVVPINSFFLDAVEGGRVEEIYLEAGSLLQKGDPILKLTNTNLLLDIMWREAELFQQSNNLRNTRLLMEQFQLQLRKDMADIDNRLRQQKRTHDRYALLAKDDLIPVHDLELARDEYEYLQTSRALIVESQEKELQLREAQLGSLEESLQRMQDNLQVVKQKQDNLTIKAPVSGHLTALAAEVGQSKAAGEGLGQIDILEGFKLRASVDEHYITRVDKGKPGEFKFAGESFQIVVNKIYPEVMEGRFEIDMTFTGTQPQEITRGQTLHVQLQLGDVSQATLLPKGGFYQTTGGSWAYVLEESGDSARRTSIRIGRENPDVFEILQGLEPGDRVITSSYEGFGNTDRLILETRE
jgi:HlyD family secretion protein